jgi:hypothetical protein
MDEIGNQAAVTLSGESPVRPNQLFAPGTRGLWLPTSAGGASGAVVNLDVSHMSEVARWHVFTKPSSRHRQRCRFLSRANCHPTTGTGRRGPLLMNRGIPKISSRSALKHSSALIPLWESTSSDTRGRACFVTYRMGYKSCSTRIDLLVCVTTS